MYLKYEDIRRVSKDFNSLKTQSVKDALTSAWFREYLTASFSCSKRLDVCAH